MIDESDRRGPVRVGIVGAGRFGRALAVRFAAAGHTVMVSNSRGPETLTDVVRSIRGAVRAGTVAEAARFGEIVGVAIPAHRIGTLPAADFAGKIVIDATNYYPEPNVRVAALDAGETTSSELLASRLQGSSVVKAFNTVQFRRVLDDSRPDVPAEERLAVPVAADDTDAKRTVIELIGRLGFTGVDAGSLANSGRQQPGSPLYLAFADSRTRGTTLTASQVRELLAAQG